MSSDLPKVVATCPEPGCGAPLRRSGIRGLRLICPHCKTIDPRALRWSCPRPDCDRPAIVDAVPGDAEWVRQRGTRNRMVRRGTKYLRCERNHVTEVEWPDELSPLRPVKRQRQRGFY